MVQVSTKAELMAELEAASPAGGVTIEMVGGVYLELRLNGSGSEPWAAYDLPVVVKSLDTEDPAIFHESIRLRFVDNLRFENITFLQQQGADTATHRVPLLVEDSTNIYFWRCTFDGNVGVGSRLGYGIQIWECSHITVNECDLFDWFYGIGCYGGSSNITIANNDIYRCRADFIQFSDALDTILVEGNYLYNTRIDGETHSDFIQIFFGPTHNLTIRGNIFTPGDGEWSQTIFLNSENGPSTNWLIEENVIHNGHVNGISTTSDVDGLIIRNNTLLRTLYTESLSPEPAIDYGAATNVTVENNIEPERGGGVDPTSLEVSYDDTGSAQYVETLFVNPLNTTNIVPLSDFRAVSAGLIETNGWGAEMTRTGVRHQWTEDGGSPPPDPPPPGIAMQLWQIWPQMLHRPENTLPQQGWRDLTAVGNSISWVIPAPIDMEASHFALRIGSVAGSPTVTVSAHVVSATTGLVTGLWATGTEVTSGTLTANTNITLAAGATASISRGDVVAFTVALASGTSAQVMAPAGLVQLVGGMPYIITTTGGTPTKSPFTASGLAVGSSATEFYSLPGFFPFSTIPLGASAAFNNASAITRRGVRFVAKFTAYLIGARMIQSVSHNGNFELRLYTAAGALIGTATAVNGTFKQAVPRYTDLYLAAPEDLLVTAGVEYRFVMVPTSTTDCYFTRLNLASSDFYSAHHGADWQYTEYDGAWDDSIVAVPVVELFWGRPS